MQDLRLQRCARSTLLAERAHGMRHSPTPSEHRLWNLALRSRRLGVEFRRQVVLSGFIVDFLAPRQKLVVEVDGRVYHQRRRAADARRERKLNRSGYRVLRLEAELVENNLAEAIRQIRAALDQAPVSWRRKLDYSEGLTRSDGQSICDLRRVQTSDVFGCRNENVRRTRPTERCRWNIFGYHSGDRARNSIVDD